jgi:hypothetical protein
MPLRLWLHSSGLAIETPCDEAGLGPWGAGEPSCFRKKAQVRDLEPVLDSVGETAVDGQGALLGIDGRFAVNDLAMSVGSRIGRCRCSL